MLRVYVGACLCCETASACRTPLAWRCLLVVCLLCIAQHVSSSHLHMTRRCCCACSNRNSMTAHLYLYPAGAAASCCCCLLLLIIIIAASPLLASRLPCEWVGNGQPPCWQLLQHPATCSHTDIGLANVAQMC